MDQAPLSCPFCGATLSFQVTIPAGSPVDCLICMRRFAAPMTYVPAPARPAAAAPADAVTSVPRPIAGALPPPSKAPAAAPSTSRPAERRPRPGGRNPDRAENRFVLLAVLAGLFLLIGGGVGVALWSMFGTRTGSDTHEPQPGPLLVQVKPPVSPVQTPTTKEKPPEGVPTKKETPPLIDDEDDRRRRKEEEEKKAPPRKDPFKGKTIEPEFNPITPVPGVPPWGVDQPKINAAIQKGIQFLKNEGKVESWAPGHYPLVGLTLLECNVPRTDPTLQKVIHFIRSNHSAMSMNYEFSATILFLDRLGDPRDRALIQWMALRIMSGQKDGGGWSYHSPPLNAEELYQLFAFLHANRHPDSAKAGPNDGDIAAPASDPREPSAQFARMLQANPILRRKLPPIRPDALGASLRTLPVVQNHARGKGQFGKMQDDGDHSNTQFAMLGLWAARRHGVPTDPALLAAYERLVQWQLADGGWSYDLNMQNSTPTMTCVGLLAHAIGHGIRPEYALDPKTQTQKIKPVLDDPRVQRGLKLLAQSVGEPKKVKADFPMENLYLLWSIERVAMLFDLKTIERKDWYGWGAQVLLHHQSENGSWPSAEYTGNNPNVNTCFALLFLRRSNLVQDLTENLRLQTAIRE